MNLELVNLSKKYGKMEALHDFSATLENGIYGLLGPNGAGKSTLMNIITGLMKPSGGKVLFEGRNIDEMGKQYRKILGYLPQNPGLYPFYTGFQLLSYFAKLKAVDASKERLYELLEMVHLAQDADKKVGEYSGGMKKRIGIAIALLNNPKLIVMDEPTAGLDPKERIRFRSIVSKIKYESIIIISTHIVSDVEHIADNIILMNEGKLLEHDRCNNLIDNMKNNVWCVDVDNENVLEYSEKYKMVNAVNIDKEHSRIRIIGESKPSENAQSVYPTLEDIYMYYFGSDD